MTKGDDVGPAERSLRQRTTGGGIDMLGAHKRC